MKRFIRSKRSSAQICEEIKHKNPESQGMGSGMGGTSTKISQRIQSYMRLQWKGF